MTKKMPSASPLAAGSVMSGDGRAGPGEERNLIQKTQRARRILLDEPVNTGSPADPSR